MEVLQVLCLILIILIGYQPIQGRSQQFKPPRIITDYNEHIIKTNQNLTLRCEGNRPITWSYPNNTYSDDEPVRRSLITITPSETPDSEFTYGSILSINEASYIDTGFYYCHTTDTDDLEDLSKSVKIYLYVQDPDHLSVLSELPFAVSVSQYSEVILPCRPTSPDINVELFQTTGEEVFLDIPNENGIIVKFDPRRGFIISQVIADDSILYGCHFFKDNKSFNATMILNVQPITDSIAKPHIEELTGGHTVVGEKLELKCTLRVDVQSIMEWVTPDPNGINIGRINISKSTKETHDVYYQLLTINNATLGDQGEYTCVVRDLHHVNNNTKYVRIFDKDEHFINLTEENGVYNISVQAGAPDVQWRIDVNAHPPAKLVWIGNNNKPIQAGWSDIKNQKYEVRSQNTTEAFLKIHDITIYDRGNYTLKAINEFEQISLSLFLDVTDKPTVQIETQSFHLLHEQSVVKCKVAAFPIPSIYWYFKPCQDNSCDYQPHNQSYSKSDDLLEISYLNITAMESGMLMCIANNSLGTDRSIVGFYVTEVTDGFGIWGLDEETAEMENGIDKIPVALDETLTLYCGASRYNFSDQLQWFKIINNELVILQNQEKFAIEKSTTEFSNKLTLSIKNVNYSDSGSYSCQVSEKKENRSIYANITISVKDPTLPVITNSNLNGSDFILSFPNRLELWCFAKGIPKPEITWYKNDEEWSEHLAHGRAQTFDHNHRLIFQTTQAEDEGKYACKAANKVGSDQTKMVLKFDNKPGLHWSYIVSMVVLFSFCSMMIIYIYIKYAKEKKLRQELKRAGLANFENGALNSLNPELGIDDQAELLPYDKKWEFPREKLKLGKQLGSGAFGVVMKAIATGIVPNEESTTVAVKMVKRNADYIYIRALASELKIMVHLGKHLNVVNLLGACTKNVAKRELLVIVEYCRFGNLHNYLLRHRNSFINQIDSKSGRIDYILGSEILERSFSISSSKSDNNVLPKNMADYRGNSNYSGDTAYTTSTTVSMTPTGGEDGLVTSNNSIQPEWRSNYRGDYKGNVKPICTKDLITWAFQVARGMEYLASRKVLHGDLAARNILLAENNIVKICDFGLAKSMYKSDNYKKRGDGPLPVKWMAVESIRDRVFSTQSDVWAYGIVLWEFFSLARTPYPGMEANETLYNKLVEGYRMDAPEYATKEIFEMMNKCWHPKPLSRPSFTNLAETIGLMLEESVRQHYVDLNDPYLVMNTQRLEEGKSDYLAMLSPPDFEQLSSPHHYVNDDVRPDTIPTSPASPDESNQNQNPIDTPGYLCMKPMQIFSPRQFDKNVFSFDLDKKHKNSNGEVASGTELLPMLHLQNDSDCDTPNTPKSPNSFSNPSYHIPPKISEKDIVKTADNYINMPQNKSAIKNDKTNTNLNSNANTDAANNYVNSSSRKWE